MRMVSPFNIKIETEIESMHSSRVKLILKIKVKTTFKFIKQSNDQINKATRTITCTYTALYAQVLHTLHAHCTFYNSRTGPTTRENWIFNNSSLSFQILWTIWWQSVETNINDVEMITEWESHHNLQTLSKFPFKMWS